MQTRKEKTRMNKRMTSSLSLLMCGVLLSTSVLPTATVFAETTAPTTDSSTPVPTNGTLDTDLTETTKVPDSQTPTVPSTEDKTEDTKQPSEEVQTEESGTTTIQPSEEDKTTPPEQPENNQTTPQGKALIPQGRGIITATWGTSPVSFDESTGVLTVSAGTIAESEAQTNIGTIEQSNIKKIVFLDGVKAPTNSSKLLDGDYFRNLSIIEGNLDTSNVTDMSYMFYDSKVTSLDLSNLNTSNVTDMSYMFAISQATSVDVSNWDTAKVTKMDFMFAYSQTTSLDVSKWNTSNVTDMAWMFQNSKITSLDVSKWNTSNVTDMIAMFYNSPITFLDFSNWDTSNVTNMRAMFLQTLINSLTLGEKSKFSKDVLLPAIDTSTGVYTGKWERIDPVSPISEYDSSDNFMENYDGSQPGTYVWQKVKVPAKDLTIYYQDTDGKEISKPKTVSGNVGDKFKEVPLDIEGYTFKEVKDNTPTEGTLSDKEQSITFIYTKNPVKAKDLTVYYQDTDGNDISKSKTISGNVGDTFNESPITIEGYSFKEVKDNTPTEGTLSDKDQSITFIYTKNPVEPSKDKNEKATATGTTSSSNTDGESGTQELGKDKASSSTKSLNSQNNKDLKSLPKTGENISPIATFAGVATLILALFVWLFRRKQSK